MNLSIFECTQKCSVDCYCSSTDFKIQQLYIVFIRVLSLSFFRQQLLYSLMEKGQNNNRRDSEESNCMLLKNRLELILSTLQEERQQYEEEHRQCISKLLKEISQKNQLIITLRKDLRNTNKQLQLSEQESDKYRQIIAKLKLQFFKMGKVVNKINTHFDFRPPRQKELKQVKSQQKLQRPPPVPHFQLCVSPIKTIKFDINAYFNSLKQSKEVKTERYYLEEKKSIHSKKTDDRSIIDSAGNLAAQTTQFKDLLNNQLGLSSKFRESKPCLTNTGLLSKKYTKSQLDWCKENTWQVNQ